MPFYQTYIINTNLLYLVVCYLSLGVQPLRLLVVYFDLVSLLGYIPNMYINTP
jgi:hypothetical protein